MNAICGLYACFIQTLKGLSTMLKSTFSILIHTLLMLVLAFPTFAADNVVNVYSYRQPQLVKPLFDDFTAKTGIDVNVVFLNKGMIERLKTEGKRSPADVILTVDISRLKAAVDAGVTQTVNSPIINKNIPAQHRDPNNQWFGLTTRARVVYASKERVKDGEITTYEDLANPKWRGRICTRSGTHVYMLALTSAVIEHHGTDIARSWLAGLKSNLARRPQGNDRAQVKAIWAGECDISIGNTYYMGKMLEDSEQRKWAESVRIVFPHFADGGTHVNISGMAMTKYAPHPDAALALMEYLTSADAQRIYASANYEYPILGGVPLSPVVREWGSFTADKITLSDIANERVNALRITEAVDYDAP